MKYLALLKDSFREAVDTKVFYIMVAMSSVVTLLIAMIGYRPKPAAEFGEHLALPLNGDTLELIRGRQGKKPPTSITFYTFSSVEPLDGQPDLPGSQLFPPLRAR